MTQLFQRRQTIEEVEDELPVLGTGQTSYDTEEDKSDSPSAECLSEVPI
jgi:hypothetical protein